MKEKKGTASDFFNRLQPALVGKALRLAQEFKGRQDPYGEAMKKLHAEFGDEVELALEHLRPIKDPKEAMDAAEKAWERFSGQESALQKRGIELVDLLWHQMVMKILPAHLEPQKRWNKWIEEQRRNHSQTQANLPEGKIKKGKSLTNPKENVTYPPSHLKGKDTTSTYLTNRLTHLKKNVTYLSTDLDLEKTNPTLTYLPEFRTAKYYARAEISRFFREMGEDYRQSGPAPTPAATNPSFHVKRATEGQNCLKCGPESDHRTDSCAKIGTMSAKDWRLLAGEHCMRCGLHLHVVGQRCSYK
jgi:hypothetical protein